MSRNRFVPIRDQEHLFELINYIHFGCYILCKQSFGKYFENAGNMGVFAHLEREYENLISIREKLTKPSDNLNQKYYELCEPIVIQAKDDVPKTTYTHLYIRKPDPTPYGEYLGDVDFYAEPEEYAKYIDALLNGAQINGARIYDRPGVDMIQLYDSDIDVVGYLSTSEQAEKMRVIQNYSKERRSSTE